MPFLEDKFAQVINTKKIPVLTLDNKWHQLFTQTGITKEIKQLEKQLNELLKKQGKMTTELKDLKKIKSNLMTEIMDSLEAIEKDAIDKKTEKKLNDNKRLISEINDKMDQDEDNLYEIPKQIDALNRELMLKTMEVCYSKLHSNTDSIEEIARWIKNIRIELKKNIIRKQEQEQNNLELYSYMHDIFGAEVMEMFDMKYNPLKKKEAEDAVKKENEDLQKSREQTEKESK